MLQEDHVTLNRKVKLSDNLVNFTSEAGVLRDNYYSALVNETKFVNSAIYITENEKNEKSKLNNQTKAQIHRLILEKLESFPELEGKLMEELFNKSVKGKNKDAYIAFYHDLSENDNCA